MKRFRKIAHAICLSVAVAAIAAAAGFALSGTPAYAEDEAVPAASTPARVAYDKARASLPAPSDDRALLVEGHTVFEDSVLGTFSVTVAKVTHNKLPAWFTEFRTHLKGRGDISDAAHVSSNFDTLDGSLSVSDLDRPADLLFWVTEPEGIRISRPGAADKAAPSEESDAEDAPAKNPSELVENQGSFLGTIAQLLQFTRLSKHAAGPFEAPWFDAGDRDVHTFRWRAGEEGRWGGVKARLLTGTRSDGMEVRAAFEPKTDAVLGFSMKTTDGTLEYRTGPSELDAFYRDPPKSPQQAAAQAALAFATADFALLERVAHWPSIVEMARKAFEDDSLDETLVRAYVKSRLKPTLGPKARAGFAEKLQARSAKLKAEENEDGSTTVPFGTHAKSLRIKLRELGEQWYLVEIPKGVLR